MKKVELWKQFAGAEAIIGKDWLDILQNLQNAKESWNVLKPDEADDAMVLRDNAAIQAYVARRPDAISLLRKDCELTADQNAHDLLRRRYKRFSACRATTAREDQIKALEFMSPIALVIPAADGLRTALRDNLSELNETSARDSLHTILTSRLETFPDAEALLKAMKEAANTTKRAEDLAEMKGCFKLVFEMLKKEITGRDTITIGELKPALDLLKALDDERGVLGTDVWVRKHSQVCQLLAMQIAEFTDDITKLNAAAETSAPPNRAQLMLTLDHMDILKVSLDSALPEPTKCTQSLDSHKARFPWPSGLHIVIVCQGLPTAISFDSLDLS